MKKHVLMTAVLGMVGMPAMVLAASVDSEVDAELDQMYSARQAQKGAPVAGTIAPQGTQSGQPIYILNQATPTSNAGALAQQVQKQPTTYIEAAPLTKSRAEQIREARQQVETDTETKIVEKLEISRMEDEKRRANVLFGEQFNSLGQQQQQLAPAQPVAVVPAPAPVPVVVQAAPVAPVPVVAVEEVDTKELVREEVRAALAEKAKDKVESTSTKYFTGIAGVGDYPDVKNVRGNYLLGASIGSKFDNVWAVEGAFIYSNYTAQKLDGYPQVAFDQYGNQIFVPPLMDVNQYGLSLAVKYLMLEGAVIRPILGGVAQYSYRTFSWSSENPGYSNGGNSDVTSHAVDLGFITGADFEFNPKFTLGIDFRYLFNVYDRQVTNNNNYFLTNNAYGTAIEKLQYFNFSVAGRFVF